MADIGSTEFGGVFRQDPAASSPEVSADLNYMMNNDVQKAVYKGEEGGAVKDGDGNPVGMLNLSFGKFVLSLDFPQFEGKPDSSVSRVEMTEQFRDFRLKTMPEVNDLDKTIIITLVGPANKKITIKSTKWAYFKGLQI